MELPDRYFLELEFAARIAKLSKRQRAELEGLLGDSPDLRNVPEETWQRWEQENRDQFLTILLLIAASSAEFHGSDPGDEIIATTLTGWADQRSKEVASDISMTTRNRLTEFFAEIERARLDRPLGPLPGDDDVDPTDPDEIWKRLDEEIESLYGEKRADSIAKNETTAAQTIGGEIGIEATVGLSPDDVWLNHPELSQAGPCQICAPLHNQSRSMWGRFFPDGPPGPHPGCVCSIQYANVGKELAAQ